MFRIIAFFMIMLFARLYVRIYILLTCGKYLQCCIISLRGNSNNTAPSIGARWGQRERNITTGLFGLTKRGHFVATLFETEIGAPVNIRSMMILSSIDLPRFVKTLK